MSDEAGATPEQNAVTVDANAAGGATATIDREALDAGRQEAAEAAEQEQLLAGKFKSQDDLIKGYEELEKKLGQKSQQPAQEGAENNEENPDGDKATEGEEESGEADKGGDESPYGEVVSAAIEKAGIDVEASVKAFEETGTLSDEDFAKFAEAGFPREVVDAYLRGAASQQSEAASLVQSQVDAIKASVGGDEAFADLQKFIQGSYTTEEKAAYNEAVGTGDFEKALGAVNAAKARRAKDIGHEATLHSGKAQEGGNGYASEAEMLEDMKNPKYKTSEAFRQQVTKKIAASSFHVVR